MALCAPPAVALLRGRVALSTYIVAELSCLVYTSAWWQRGRPVLASGAQQTKQEDKVMPPLTSRTIKKEFKSSKKNEQKERKQIAAWSRSRSLLLPLLCFCFCLPCCNATLLVETPHFNSTGRLCAACASYTRPFGPPSSYSDRDSRVMAMEQEIVKTPAAGALQGLGCVASTVFTNVAPRNEGVRRSA